MADADVQVEEEIRPRRNINIFNILSGCVVLLTILMCLCALTIFVNPRAPYNLFPPATITLTPSVTPIPTHTPRPPTNTPAPSATSTEAPTPASSPTPGGAQFNITVTARRQFLADRSCEDISFGGEVLDSNGDPLRGYVVEVSRTDGFLRISESGSQPGYGDSGWEVLISDQTVHQTYTIQLFDPDGVAVSPPHDEVTSNNCDESLIVIDFRQATP